jgi:predicted alpha/beta hydrolase
MSSATAPEIADDAGPCVEDVRIATADGRFLAGRLHRPSGEPRLAVVLHGGAGFPARFYQDFAAWFARTHHAAFLTYDYRDFGWSLDGPLAKSDATLSDWGIKDQSAALNFLLDRFPDLPVRVLGHSLGGQWLAFHEGVGRIDRAVVIASGPGYWRDHPWPMLPKVVVFWWLLGPLAARLTGHMPGEALGLGADIPAGVYWEWRRLCLRRDYHRSEWGQAYPQPRLEAAKFELTIVPIADDALIAPHMVRKLPAFYPHAQVGETLLSPDQLGLKSIGHGGAFLARNNSCWPIISAPLIK